MLDRLKAQVGKIELNEFYTQAMIMFGVPGIVWLYTSRREALAAFVLIQITLGILRARTTE